MPLIPPDDPLSKALRRLVWRKRTEYLDEAVRRGIITTEQAESLHLLRLEMDDAVDREEE